MNNYISFSEEMCRDYFNVQPSMVKGKANKGTAYYKRVLYTKLYSCFEFKIPTQWKLNFFRLLLFHYGSGAVIYTNEYGWVFQPYGIAEIDLYYNPRLITVYNQFFDDVKYGLIGVNAGLVHCFDDYFGFDDIVTRYAVMLAECDSSINVNLMNTKVAYAFLCRDKKEGDTIGELFDQVSSGKPYVIFNNRSALKDTPPETFLPEVKKNFIASDVATLKRSIINMFLTEIGIANANTEKKERLISDEVNANNNETEAIISVVYNNIKKDFEIINKISGLDLDVKLHYESEVNNEQNNAERLVSV